MIKKDKSTLFIFTGSYPFSSAAEDTFLDPELPDLLNNFSDIYIVPKSIEGTRCSVPNTIIVDLSLAKKIIKTQNLIMNFSLKFMICLTSKHFYYEIVKNRKYFFHISAFIRLVNFLASALIIEKWTNKQIINHNIDLNRTLFYTYWLDDITFGLSLSKKKFPDIKIVSRAHGADLYEDRIFPPYIPFRYESLKSLERLYLISEHGKKYLSSRYPMFSSKYFVCHLGVEDPHFSTNVSTDNEFRIASCSFLVPVKRIDLLIIGLKLLGEKTPNQNFEWTHIGDGPLLSELKENAEKNLPYNMKFKFLGRLTKGEVIDYYRNNHVDLFINTSSSEGIPLTIMEAQSCGIPVIAPAVGGIPEIVSEETGVLLDPNPHPENIAKAISIFVNDSLLSEKKISSKRNWKEKYNAEINFQIFANNLQELLTKKLKTSV